MGTLSNGRIQLLIALVAVLLFVPGLGAVHLFDWDEINFAEITREMLASHNWLQPQIAYEPFYEKPPLFIWLQAISMSVFGVGEFAARLPDALCGVITLLILFRIGTRLKDRTFGLLWVLAYAGSILPHLYFRSGIIDPWFNLFIFLGLLCIIGISDTPANTGTSDHAKNRAAVLAGLSLGLAVLTKGPVGALIPALCIGVYWVSRRCKPFISIKRLLLMGAALLVLPCLWFGIDLVHNGPTFITAFFWRQVAMLSTEDAGHGGFFAYHFVILLIGCFPASVFALQELVKPSKESDQLNDQRRWMTILFWVVLILFSIVQTKIVHYSSLCYFPLTYLAALQLHRLWNGGVATLWSRLLMGAIGTVFAIVTLAVPFIGMHIQLLDPLVANDAFARANLQADVHWSGFEVIAGIWMVIVLFLGHRFFTKAMYRKGIIAVFGGTAIFVTLTLYFFINNIEGYSQRAAITFFEQRQGERCYVTTKDYKSYAQLFYTRMPPITDARAHNEQWLLTGNVDRPVYVVCKITSAEEVEAIPTLNELGRSNGFIFYER